MLFITQELFSATQAQVEEYLSISGTDKQMNELVQRVSIRQNRLETKHDTSATRYDIELFSLRFAEYLETHISESEMVKVLSTYKNVLFLSYISSKTPKNSATLISEDNNLSVRIELVFKLYKAQHLGENEEKLFDMLIVPLIKAAYTEQFNGKSLSPNTIKADKEKFFKRKKQKRLSAMLHQSENYSVEELEQILAMFKSPIISKEQKIKSDALGYALEEYLNQIITQRSAKDFLNDVGKK